jgi:hypothetical protein
MKKTDKQKPKTKQKKKKRQILARTQEKGILIYAG